MQIVVSTVPGQPASGALAPPVHPITFFREWLSQAFASCPMAHAMILATASRDGLTSLRTVLLKACGPDGFVFFTTAGSRKARQLAGNPHASLLFYWPDLRRQVRIEGTAARVPMTTLLRGLLSRGGRHAALTWVPPHSQLEDAREILAGGVRGTCGFLISPRTVSFWQGGTGRRHASLDYERSDDGWIHRVSGPDDLIAALGLRPDEPRGALT